jgi:hypothetical protein
MGAPCALPFSTGVAVMKIMPIRLVCAAAVIALLALTASVPSVSGQKALQVEKEVPLPPGTKSGTVADQGDAAIPEKDTNKGEVDVHYRVLFASPPNISIVSSERENYAIVEQKADHFKIKNYSGFRDRIKWRVEGQLVALTNRGAPEPAQKEERLDRLEKRLENIEAQLGKLEKLLSSIDAKTSTNGQILQKGFDELIKRAPPPKP